jgi:hypothetical protein
MSATLDRSSVALTFALREALERASAAELGAREADAAAKLFVGWANDAEARWERAELRVVAAEQRAAWLEAQLAQRKAAKRGPLRAPPSNQFCKVTP